MDGVVLSQTTYNLLSPTPPLPSPSSIRQCPARSTSATFSHPVPPTLLSWPSSCIKGGKQGDQDKEEDHHNDDYDNEVEEGEKNRSVVDISTTPAAAATVPFPGTKPFAITSLVTQPHGGCLVHTAMTGPTAVVASAAMVAHAADERRYDEEEAWDRTPGKRHGLDSDTGSNNRNHNVQTHKSGEPYDDVGDRAGMSDLDMLEAPPLAPSDRLSILPYHPHPNAQAALAFPKRVSATTTSTNTNNTTVAAGVHPAAHFSGPVYLAAAADVSNPFPYPAGDDFPCDAGLGMRSPDTTDAVEKNTWVQRHLCKAAGCGKSFTTSAHLSRHAKLHMGIKPHHCPLPGCTKGFARRDNMMVHYRAHARKMGLAVAPPVETRKQTTAFGQGDCRSSLSMHMTTGFEQSDGGDVGGNGVGRGGAGVPTSSASAKAYALVSPVHVHHHHPHSLPQQHIHAATVGPLGMDPDTYFRMPHPQYTKYTYDRPALSYPGHPHQQQQHHPVQPGSYPHSIAAASAAAVAAGFRASAPPMATATTVQPYPPPPPRYAPSVWLTAPAAGGPGCGQSTASFVYDRQPQLLQSCVGLRNYMPVAGPTAYTTAAVPVSSSTSTVTAQHVPDVGGSGALGASSGMGEDAGSSTVAGEHYTYHRGGLAGVARSPSVDRSHTASVTAPPSKSSTVPRMVGVFAPNVAAAAAAAAATTAMDLAGNQAPHHHHHHPPRSSGAGGHHGFHLVNNVVDHHYHHHHHHHPPPDHLQLPNNPHHSHVGNDHSHEADPVDNDDDDDASPSNESPAHSRHALSTSHGHLSATSMTAGMTGVLIGTRGA